MAQQTPARKLFDLLVSRDFEPELLDSAGKPAQDPAETEVFSFDFRAQSGKDYGTVVILLGNDNDLEVYSGDNVGKTMEGEDKEDWFDFLGQIKDFATRNLLSFSTKNLNRLRYSMQGQAAIKEGLFESWQGKRDVSWNAGPTEARLMIKHNRKLGESDARYRFIESLFIETAEGERYKLPFKKLTGGRAMLEHVRQGGKPYDLRGQHIVAMVEELNLLTRFRRASQGQIFEGDTADLVEQTNAYYESANKILKHLGTARGYGNYFESWNPVEITDQDVVIENIKHLFVRETLDDRIAEALPLLARIQKQGQAMKEANIFEAWANRLMEGTWSVPDTPEKQEQLVSLFSNGLPVGADATNATEQLYDLLGDDILFDRLGDLAERDANANCWEDPAVLARVKELAEHPDVAKVLAQVDMDVDTPAEPSDQELAEGRMGEIDAAIQERLVAGMPPEEIARELDIPLDWVEEYKFTKVSDSPVDMFGNQLDRQFSSMNEREQLDEFLPALVAGAAELAGSALGRMALTSAGNAAIDNITGDEVEESDSEIARIKQLAGNKEETDENIALPIIGALGGAGLGGAGGEALGQAFGGDVGGAIGQSIGQEKAGTLGGMIGKAMGKSSGATQGGTAGKNLGMALGGAAGLAGGAALDSATGKDKKESDKEETDEGLLGTLGGAALGAASPIPFGTLIGGILGHQATKGGSSLIEKEVDEGLLGSLGGAALGSIAGPIGSVVGGILGHQATKGGSSLIEYEIEPDEYCILRYKSPKDIERGITKSSLWEPIKEFDSFQEAQQMYRDLKAKNPNAKFEITFHKKKENVEEYTAGAAFEDEVEEGLDSDGVMMAKPSNMSSESIENEGVLDAIGGAIKQAVPIFSEEEKSEHQEKLERLERLHDLARRIGNKEKVERLFAEISEMRKTMEGWKGQLAGGTAGTLAGSAIGSLAGPIGTVIGGALGGTAGQMAGDKLGGPEEPEQPEETDEGAVGSVLGQAVGKKLGTAAGVVGSNLAKKMGVNVGKMALARAGRATGQALGQEIGDVAGTALADKIKGKLHGQYGHSGKLQDVKPNTPDMTDRIKFLAGIKK